MRLQLHLSGRLARMRGLSSRLAIVFATALHGKSAFATTKMTQEQRRGVVGRERGATLNTPTKALLFAVPLL